MKSIITRLQGGLGNQMFQYAAGRAISARTGLPLRLDITNLSSKSHRDYELNAFNIINHTYRRPGEGRPDRLTRLLDAIRLQDNAPDPAPIYHEPHYHYDETFEKIDRECILDGYWQTEKYFLKISDLIRLEFQPREIPAQALEISRQIAQCNSVSVHVRRGDYASNPEVTRYHGICSLDYYTSSMADIAEDIEDPTFFVFSDDHAWIQANFPRKHPWILVADWPKKSAWVDMWLMSQCKNHIIANSSYSWWGAWLNPSTKKNVIAPEKWFSNAPNNTKDLIPKEWTIHK